MNIVVQTIARKCCGEPSEIRKACVSGDVNRVRRILNDTYSDKPEVINTLKDDCLYHSSLLISAALFGQTNVVEFLLKNRANPNDVNDRGESALMHAVKYNNTEMVRVLIAHGADVNQIYNISACCGIINARLNPLACATTSDMDSLLTSYGAEPLSDNQMHRNDLNLYYSFRFICRTILMLGMLYTLITSVSDDSKPKAIIAEL